MTLLAVEMHTISMYTHTYTHTRGKTLLSQGKEGSCDADERCGLQLPPVGLIMASLWGVNNTDGIHEEKLSTFLTLSR